MAPCHITLHMSSVHAGRAGYGDTSWHSDETPGVSTGVPPSVPANPHASMDGSGSRNERTAQDLLVGTVASAYFRCRIPASDRWERAYTDRIRALCSASDQVQTGRMLTAENRLGR